MPKKFTDFERNMIRRQLMDTGKKLFEKHGFKKTSIDQIVYEVGIAKGSFYKFFDNKETLFYYILEEIEIELNRQALKVFHEDERAFIPKFKDFFRFQLEYIRSEPLFESSMDSQFMAAIWAKLPEKIQARSHQVDIDKIKDLRELTEAYNIYLKFDDHTLSGIFRSLAFMLIHNDIMGTAAPEVIDFYIDVVISNLFQEVS